MAIMWALGMAGSERETQYDVNKREKAKKREKE